MGRAKYIKEKVWFGGENGLKTNSVQTDLFPKTLFIQRMKFSARKNVVSKSIEQIKILRSKKSIVQEILDQKQFRSEIC